MSQNQYIDVIFRICEVNLSHAQVARLDSIFFEASATRGFPSAEVQEAFRKRWLGNYLEHMVAESATRLGVARLDELKRKHGRDLCRGLDQGLHNVLVRTRLSPTTTVLPSRRSALFHGNEMHCDADVVLNGSRLSYAPTVDAAAAPPPIAIAHQFGRIRGGCQRAVRRALTCREEAPAARAAATGQSSAAAASAAAWWRRPSYCAVCAQLWPQWLGDSADSWRTSDQ